MKRISLRSRLIVAFCILITLAWVISAGMSYVKTRQRIRYIFDAQQLIFAQRLEDSNLSELILNPASSGLLAAKQNDFTKANDALSFAIFSADGKQLITDRPGENAFLYDPSVIISDEPTFYDSDKWRILWHKTADRQFIIAVGQENAYRNKMTGDIIFDHQITPWFVIMPFLIAAIIYLINRELSPIKQVSRSLSQRKPDDSTPIENNRLPSEIQPLLDALNSLFERTSATIERERRFVSDAAHELRSPLSALQVQAEVAQISINKPDIQLKALNNLTTGVARASRLIDQLLTLSKLDSFSELSNKQLIDWKLVIDSLVMDLTKEAESKNISVCTEYEQLPEPQLGDPLLLTLMMRNLIDNALRYTLDNGHIIIKLSKNEIAVLDDGPGISIENLPRIGQRFYRPPGQKQTGSGLGLSIARQIADLHGFSFTFGNRDCGGFYSKIVFSK